LPEAGDRLLTTFEQCPTFDRQPSWKRYREPSQRLAIQEVLEHNHHASLRLSECSDTIRAHRALFWVNQIMYPFYSRLLIVRL
jgi:hypothetical protein